MHSVQSHELCVGNLDLGFKLVKMQIDFGYKCAPHSQTDDEKMGKIENPFASYGMEHIT